jgi:DNA-directed RNA polymerase subunit RPC12/RpoP
MTAEASKIWRCTSCNRLLIEKSVDYARARHAELVERTRGGSVEFVREATWPAYLASLKRCRCGSRRQLKAVPPGVVRGQLDLQIDAVVLQ